MGFYGGGTKGEEKEIMRVTLLGSFANFVLLVFKFVAGIWGHSSAMIADAVHSLSDFVTDIIVLLLSIYLPSQRTRAMITGMVNTRLWRLQLSVSSCFV